MSYRYLGAVLDQAQAESAVSQGMDFTMFDGASIHAVYGAVAAVLTLEANDDPVGFPDDWVTVSEVTFESIAGVAGKQLIEISNMRSRWYRIREVYSSGTGAMRVVVHAKSA